MKFITSEQIQANRKKRNKDLLKRMQDGDPLQTHDAYSSWYPPRPVIKKDKDAISKLYHVESELLSDSDRISLITVETNPTRKAK